MNINFGDFTHKKFKKIITAKKNPGKYEKLYLEKTYKYINYIKWIPGLKMIGIGNSLSMNSGNKNSDIDLFIITDVDRMRLVRILVTLVFSILGERKTSRSHAGKFCLSFYATTNAMNFGHFAIDQDIYLYFWIIYLQPLLSYDKTYEKFIDQNSKWANFSDYTQKINNNKKYIKFVKNNCTSDGGFLTIVNKLLKKGGEKKALHSYKKLNKPYGIIISQDMLKFHNNDMRKKIRDGLT